MSSTFDEIEPIFRFLCECTMYDPNDINSIRSLVRAAHDILDSPRLADDLIKNANLHLALPDEMIALKQESQECLMAKTWKFVEERETFAADVERERAITTGAFMVWSAMNADRVAHPQA